MKYELYYGNFTYEVEQNYLDILSYEFEKTFNEEYVPYYTLYTPEQNAYVKEFETKWLNNEIHEYDYYTTRNYEFLDWLKEKYADDAEEAQYEEESAYEDLEPDDWWYNLDYSVKLGVMEDYFDAR